MKENITKSIFLLLLFLLNVHFSFGQLISQINFNEIEVIEYQIEKEQGRAILEMAYAQHQIKNPEIWNRVSKGAEVLSVDLIFTKYPRKKNDWITDYDYLLNSRIKNIMALIPSLKENKHIAWNIILQNKCVKEPEAQAMFHGAVIHYRKTEDQVITALLDSQSIKKEIDKAPLVPVKLTEKAPEPTDGEKYKYIGFYDIDKILKGKLPIKDSLIFHIFNRNPHWKNMLVVNDWTASMYIYGTQAVMWQKDKLDDQRICQFIFFNDGNKKHNDKKVSGKTGGIYSVKADNMEKVIKTMRNVMSKGQGGDREENDIEAIIYAANKFKDAKEIILIADNKSEVRDIELLYEVEKPIRIIVCGTSQKSSIREDYIRLAMKTKGSLHTLNADYTDLHSLDEGETVFIEDLKYKLINHQLKMISDMLD